MIGMDIFRGGAAGGAFSSISLTTAIRDIKYTPSLLTGMPGLITKVPVYTEKFAVERMADSQRLTPVPERGSPRTRGAPPRPPASPATAATSATSAPSAPPRSMNCAPWNWPTSARSERKPALRRCSAN